MPFSAEQLNRLNADYTAVTGKPAKRFVCPITLRDDPVAELCGGHVLNDSIKHASKAKVVQYSDVNNYFGETIEPDLVKLLNMPVAKPQELIRHGRDLTITGPSGEKIETFFANEKAREKFQQLDLLNADGETIASPFLRNATLEHKLHKDLQVEWLTVVTNSAIIGSMVKSAFLALFRLIGYRYTLSIAGDKVRRALAAFYTARADKAQSVNYFSEFAGAFNVMLSEMPDDFRDTLNDGAFWLHFAKDEECPILFAQTCLFKVNGRLITVTVPASEKDIYYLMAYNHYRSLMRGEVVPQNILYGRYDKDHYEVDPRPLQIKYAPKPSVGSTKEVK